MSDTPKVFDVDVTLTVRVTVSDPLVLQRPIENIDGWRDDLYNLKTRDDVLHHLAFNAVANGLKNGRLLDGWADLDEEALSMELDRTTFDVESVREAT